MNWWEDHKNLAILAWYMAHEGDAARDVAYMLGKPWAWGAEWREAMSLRDVAMILEDVADAE